MEMAARLGMAGQQGTQHRGLAGRCPRPTYEDTMSRLRAYQQYRLEEACQQLDESRGCGFRV